MPHVDFKFEHIETNIYTGTVKPMNYIHAHCDVEFVWVRAGELTYQFSNVEMSFRQGALYIFNSVFPHRIIKCDIGTKIDVVTFPFRYMLLWKLPSSIMEPLLHGDVIVDKSSIEFERDAVRLGRWMNDISCSNAQHLNIFFLEIRARLERIILDENGLGTIKKDNPATHVSHRTKIVPAVNNDLVVNVMNFILSNLSSRINLSEIASYVGKNSSYISTTFKMEYGISIVEFISEQRVEQAKFLLALTDMPITTVCYEVGFGSLSRFYATFTTRVSISPKMFRTMYRREHYGNTAHPD
ncbi:helix-turn-helix domain-containing protein [Aeromonas jandaei]